MQGSLMYSTVYEFAVNAQLLNGTWRGWSRETAISTLGFSVAAAALVLVVVSTPTAVQLAFALTAVEALFSDLVRPCGGDVFCCGNFGVIMLDKKQQKRVLKDQKLVQKDLATSAMTINKRLKVKKIKK